MRPEAVLQHEFVEHIPNEVKPGVLYVSIPYATVVHKCCCGCGSEVVTPLSPTDWKLIFDGETVSLYPSVGNWSFACRSHYWIRHNRVKWASQWSQEQIEAGRAADSRAKERHFAQKQTASSDATESPGVPKEAPQRESFWQKVKRRLFG